MEYFAISDIHGQNRKLDKLLHYWNPDTQQLILLGDYIDRGPDSLAVLQRVKQLKDSYGAIVNRGNHEDMFLTWFDDPVDPDDYYFQNVGISTLLSFLKDYSVQKSASLPFILSSKMVRDYIQDKHPDLIQLMKETSLYHETDGYIFVHAGFNPALRNWKNSSMNDFLWIRQPFIYQKNETGKIAVFGHTNTCLLHNDGENNNVWIDPWQTKIGIDGGAGSNRNLNGLVLNDEDGLSNIKVYQT